MEVEEEGVEEEIIRTNLKRKRKDHDDDTTPRRRSVVASEPMGEVQVSYTAQNLPPELTKCERVPPPSFISLCPF